MSGMEHTLDRRTTSERILLAVEVGPNAPLVIGACARLAQRLHAEVVVLSVRERVMARGGARGYRRSSEVAEVVNQALYELRRRGLICQGVVGRARVGKVADRIVYGAITHQVDEIVIGLPKRSLIGRMFTNNVATGVLRLSPVPVLAVPTGRAGFSFPPETSAARISARGLNWGCVIGSRSSVRDGEVGVDRGPRRSGPRACPACP